jgi:hypothetical protein
MFCSNVQEGGGARARGPPEYRTALASRPARRGPRRRPRFQGARRRTAGAPTATPAGALAQVGIHHHRNHPVAITRALGAYARRTDHFRRHTNFTRRAPSRAHPVEPPRRPRPRRAARRHPPSKYHRRYEKQPCRPQPRRRQRNAARPAGGRGECEVSPGAALLEGSASTLTTSSVRPRRRPPSNTAQVHGVTGAVHFFFARAHPSSHALAREKVAGARSKAATTWHPLGPGAAVVATPRPSRAGRRSRYARPERAPPSGGPVSPCDVLAPRRQRAKVAPPLAPTPARADGGAPCARLPAEDRGRRRAPARAARTPPGASAIQIGIIYERLTR